MRVRVEESVGERNVLGTRRFVTRRNPPGSPCGVGDGETAGGNSRAKSNKRKIGRREAEREDYQQVLDMCRKRFTRAREREREEKEGNRWMPKFPALTFRKIRAKSSYRTA